MRFILLFLLAITAFCAEYPQTFRSAGDKIYEDMHKYMKIKHLPIYQEKPELLEAFCQDANKTMQRGFALDEMQEDLETRIEKNIIRSYARELRQLSEQNEFISAQVDKDMLRMYRQKEFESLEQMQKAGFVLSAPMLAAINAHTKSKAAKKSPKPVGEAQKSGAGVEEPQAPLSVQMPPVTYEEEKNEEPVLEILKEQPKTVQNSELEYYRVSLADLKDELHRLRESEEEAQTACLNDITAINYWMIRVLEGEKDACALSDAIRQMKSYDKSAAQSCGAESMRYIEWHGRIKPYVGQKLFEAEAGCHR